MSRSYKKPWRKDKSNGFKQICSRAHRRISRQIVKPWKHKWIECHGWGCEDDERRAPWDDDEYEYGHCGFICNCYQFRAPMEPSFPLRKELVDQYTICDWKCYNPNEPRNFRK